MDSNVVYLTIEDIKQIHRRAMESMGWNDAPVRSEGELASALAKPQHAAYYANADLAYQAVTLAIGNS